MRSRSRPSYWRSWPAQTSLLADSARRIRHVTRCNTSRTNGIAEILWNNPNKNGVSQISEMFLVVFGANSVYNQVETDMGKAVQNN